MFYNGNRNVEEENNFLKRVAILFDAINAEDCIVNAVKVVCGAKFE